MGLFSQGFDALTLAPTTIPLVLEPWEFGRRRPLGKESGPDLPCGQSVWDEGGWASGFLPAGGGDRP